MRGRTQAQRGTTHGSCTERSSAAQPAMAGYQPAPEPAARGSAGLPAHAPRPVPAPWPAARRGAAEQKQRLGRGGVTGEGKGGTPTATRAGAEPVCPRGSTERRGSRRGALSAALPCGRLRYLSCPPPRRRTSSRSPPPQSCCPRSLRSPPPSHRDYSPSSPGNGPASSPPLLWSPEPALPAAAPPLPPAAPPRPVPARPPIGRVLPPSSVTTRAAFWELWSALRGPAGRCEGPGALRRLFAPLSCPGTLTGLLGAERAFTAAELSFVPARVSRRTPSEAVALCGGGFERGRSLPE